MRAMPSLSFLVRYHRIFEVLSVSMFEAYVIYIYIYIYIYVTYVNGDIAHVKWICKMYTAYILYLTAYFINVATYVKHVSDI